MRLSTSAGCPPGVNTHRLDHNLVSCTTVWIHSRFVILVMYHSMRHLWPLGQKSVANFCSLTKGGGRGPVRKSRLRRLMQFHDARFARDKNFMFLMSDQLRRHELTLHVAKLKGGKLMDGFEEMINAKRRQCSSCVGTGRRGGRPCTDLSIQIERVL